MALDDRKAIVNPFVFPSEITFYFILLISTVFLATFSVVFRIFYLIAYPPTPLPQEFYSISLILSTTFILLPILTFIIYRIRLRNKIAKYEKNQLNEKYPEISNLISKLCNTLGLQTPISLYTESEELDASIFNHKGKVYLLISMGLCRMFKTFPSMVETVLLHELSHLKNGDVVQHQIAESLWRAFSLITFISALSGIIVYHDLHTSLIWLLVVLFFYIIPLGGIFYLNNAIQRWREIYADIRTIALHKTRKNLANFLRFFLSSSSRKFTRVLFSPFILTPAKRLKIVHDDVFKHIIERGAIAIAISLISLFSLMFSFILIEPSLMTPSTETPAFAVFAIWFLLTCVMFSIIVLPYWTLSFKKTKKPKSIVHYIFEALTCCFKVSIILLLPMFLMAPLAASKLGALLAGILGMFLILFFQRLIFGLIIPLDQRKLSAKNKIIITEVILFSFLICVCIEMLLSEQIACILLLLVYLAVFTSILIFLVAKYLKCPYCGKNIKVDTVFVCPHCSSLINTEFLIFLED